MWLSRVAAPLRSPLCRPLCTSWTEAASSFAHKGAQDAADVCGFLTRGLRVGDARLQALVSAADDGQHALELLAAAGRTGKPSLPGPRTTEMLLDGGDVGSVARGVLGVYEEAGKRVPLAVMACLVGRAGPEAAAAMGAQVAEEAWGGRFPPLVPDGEALVGFLAAAAGGGHHDVATSVLCSAMRGMPPAKRGAMVKDVWARLGGQPAQGFRWLQAMVSTGLVAGLDRRVYAANLAAALREGAHVDVLEALEAIVAAKLSPPHHCNLTCRAVTVAKLPARAPTSTASVYAGLPSTADALLPRLIRLLQAIRAHRATGAALSANDTLRACVRLLACCESSRVSSVKHLHHLHKLCCTAKDRPRQPVFTAALGDVLRVGGADRASLAVWLLSTLKSVEGDAALPRALPHFQAAAAAAAQDHELLFQLLSFAPPTLFRSHLDGAVPWHASLPAAGLQAAAIRFAERGRRGRANDVVALLRHRREATVEVLEALAPARVTTTKRQAGNPVPLLRQALNDALFAQRVAAEAKGGAVTGHLAAALSTSDGVHRELVKVCKAVRLAANS